MSETPPNRRPESASSDPYLAQIDVVEYLRLLWRHKWKIALVTVLCGAIAAAATWLAPRTYQATVRLHVGGVPTASIGSDLMARLQRVCEAPELARDAVGDAGLDKPPLNMSPEVFASDALTFDRDDTAHVILVRVRLGDARLAGLAAASVARHAIALAVQQSGTADVEMRDRLRQSLQNSQGRFEVARSALRDFRAKNHLDTADASATGLAQLRQSLPSLEADIEAERARLKAAEALLAQMPRTVRLPAAGGSGGAAGSEALNPVYDSLRESIVASQTKLAGLESRKAYVLSPRADGYPKLSDEEALRLHQLETNLSSTRAVRDKIASDYEQVVLGSALPKPTLELAGQEVARADTLASHPARNIAAGLALGLFLSAMTVLALQAMRM